MWSNIIRLGVELEKMGINFSTSFGKKIGDGSNTRVWVDRWAENLPLGEKFNRLFNLETNKEARITERGRWINEEWKWEWGWRREPRGRELGELEELQTFLQGRSPNRGKEDHPNWWLHEDSEFTVQRLKNLIKKKEQSRGEIVEETRWSRLLSKKISIFIWRVCLGRLSCRGVLDRMGLDLHSTLCPRCGDELESVDHTLMKCKDVNLVWKEFCKWWNLPRSDFVSAVEIVGQVQKTGGSVTIEEVRTATLWSVLYQIWNHRNQIVFKDDKRKINEMVLEVQLRCFEWITGKLRGRKLDWTTWVANPVLALR